MSVELLNGIYFKVDGGGVVIVVIVLGIVDIVIGIIGGSVVNVKVDMKGNEIVEQVVVKIVVVVNDVNVGIGVFIDGVQISYVFKVSVDGIISVVFGVVIIDIGSIGVGIVVGIMMFIEVNDIVVKIDIFIVKGVQFVVLVIDEVIKQIDVQCVDFGVVQNCFDNIINNLKNIGENVLVVCGWIEDIDFVVEIVNLIKN